MKHLTRSQRDQLQALLRAKQTQIKIAKIIGCSQPTISREIQRNCSQSLKRYTATTAQIKSEKRRKMATGKLPVWHDDKNLLNKIICELKDGKTPEQISGRMKKVEITNTVSHQTIYTYIENDKILGGNLYKYLRYQGKKYKWRGFNSEKTRIPNRKDISERPTAVNKKERYGDWESDLVVSCRSGTGAVATFVERRLLFFQAIKVKDQSANEMLRATCEALKKFPKEMKNTMTHDNGKEISKHEKITKTVGIDVYCARPYKSCDRGLNEWMNRELRRFFPKGTDFSKISQENIDVAVDWLNNCPRKSLKYRTPKEVFDEQLEIMHFKV